MQTAHLSVSFVSLAFLATSAPATAQAQRAESRPAPQSRAAAAEDAAKTKAAAAISFEDVADGAVPSGWKAAETGGAGKPGVWKVESSDKAPAGKKILRLAETKNGGTTFNLLLSEAAHPADLELAVKVRADAGAGDQGGGLVWRAKDADNYYIARWNPLEENLRLYRVEAGKRKQLASADDLKADPLAWHDLRVGVAGKSMKVAFDGKEVLAAEDAAFADAGKIGFWTKGDAATSFDDLRVAHVKTAGHGR